MASVDLKTDPVWRRAKAAWKRRDQWTSLLDEAFRYVLPDSDAYGSKTPGERRHSHLFDSTAIEALADRVSRDHGALFPSGERWMGAELRVSEDQQEAASAVIESAIDKFHAAIERSNFHLEIEPAQREAYISTGCIDIHMGTPENPLRFEAVSIAQVAPEAGMDGTLQSGYRKFAMPGRQIAARWPHADLTPELAKRIEEEPDKDVALCDAVSRDEAGRFWRYRVYALKANSPDADCLLFEDVYENASPRVMFRIDRAADEWMGRGPVLALLPDIKTANKVVELVLKNASIAVTGIWQADDDGVLNPATVKLVPGTIIPKAVGSAGLTPLEAPGRFDVSQLVLGDLREKIRRGIVGPALPPANLGDRRSATEIAGRLAEQAAFEVPRTLRPTGELVQPLAARVFAILTHPAMKASPYYIEPLVEGDNAIFPVPQPPLSRIREQQEADQAAAGLAMMMQLFPEQVAGIVNLERFIENQLMVRGVRVEDFKTKAEKAAQAQQAQQAAMLQLVASAADSEGEAA